MMVIIFPISCIKLLSNVPSDDSPYGEILIKRYDERMS